METGITNNQLERKIYTYYWSNRYEKFICRYNKNRDIAYYERKKKDWIDMKKSIEKLLLKRKR